jgi:hypothetical protein
MGTRANPAQINPAPSETRIDLFIDLFITHLALSEAINGKR